MSEGRLAGRSGEGLYAAAMRHDGSAWANPPTGLSSRTSNIRIMVTSPASAWNLSSRWKDRVELVLLLWRKQAMPGSGKRRIVTARRFFHVIFMSGSALRTARRPYTKIHERNTGSLANVFHCSCRYS